MRVLWVTPYLPDPNAGGGVAHEHELLRMASRNHDIHVICAQYPAGRTTLDVDGREVTLENVGWAERRRPTTRLRRVGGILWGWPTLDQWMAAEGTRVLRRAVRGHLERGAVDLVHLTHARAAPVLSACDVPSALLLFDLYSRQLTRELAVARSPQARARIIVERARTAAWEKRWYRRAEALASVSASEAAELGETLGRQVEVIPNPVPEIYFEPPAEERTSGDVLFVGHLRWSANADAVEWLAREIWPRVAARLPKARLVVVGAQPPPHLVEVVEEAGGAVHADVADVRPYYWRAAVTVAPARMGSGLSNKILHGLACGAPVVASEVALDGFPEEFGDHVVAATDADDFAEKIVACLRDADTARERAERARPLVERHRPERIGDLLESWWQAAASSAERPSRASAATPPPAAATEDVAGRPRSATVLVCTRERPDLLRGALTSIRDAMDGRADVDLMIVEQGEPRAEAIAQELGLEASVIHDDGAGVTRARNIGIGRARGEVMLFTDDDCEVPPSWVDDHLAAFAPGVAATFGAVDKLSRFAVRRAGVASNWDPAAQGARFEAGTVPWRVGHSSNMAARRDLLLAAGGFDERLGPGASGGGDDPDMIVRLLRHGAAITGVGEPVRHVGWRSGEDDAENLVVYERGAGMWIGKALRADRREGLFYIRSRLTLLLRRVIDEPGLLRAPGPVARSLVAFVAGLARGVRLR